MLDGILGRGFASKCKSLIKLTKSRIEVIRRKRYATLKFLKNDMADLLANGLDINAYGRAEGLLAELNISSCYDFVEKSCDFVAKHLSVMQKMRHCPEDCREAVSSLMFAAARFSDLPELRDLRDIFYERYGNSLELFVNQEFAENFSSKPSTTEKKVQLMHDIASEFCIQWDSRACEQRLSRPSVSAQEQPKTYGSPHLSDDKYEPTDCKDTVLRAKHDVSHKERLDQDKNEYRLLNEKEKNVFAQERPKTYGSPHLSDDKYKPTDYKDTVLRTKHDVSHKERLDQNKNEYRLLNEKEKNVSKRNGFNPQSSYEVLGNGYKPLNVREEPTLKKDTNDGLFQGSQVVAVDKHEPWQEDTPLKTVGLGSSSYRRKKENFDTGSQLLDGRENAVPERDGQVTLTCAKPDILPSHAGSWSKADGRHSGARTHPGSQHNAADSVQDVQEEAHKLNLYYTNAIPPPYTKPNARLKDSKPKGSLGPFDIGSEGYVVPKNPLRDSRVNADNRSEKIVQEAYHHHERQNARIASSNGRKDDDGISNPIPKPKSSRRRHAKSHSSHDDVVNLEDAGVVKRRSRSRRTDDSRRGLQLLFDDEHLRNDEEERIMDKLLIHYSKKPSAYEPGKVKQKSKSHHAHHQDIDGKSPLHMDTEGPHEISEMLQPERSISLPREQTAPSEGTKVFARAASFQPDRSSAARHVHPKLPNYDDLAARFAALKGR